MLRREFSSILLGIDPMLRREFSLIGGTLGLDQTLRLEFSPIGGYFKGLIQCFGGSSP